MEVGFLDLAATNWGEKCVTYVGNEDLTEWSLDRVEAWGYEELCYPFPLENQAAQFAKFILQNGILKENKSSELMVGMEGEFECFIQNNSVWEKNKTKGV
jgi:hypothetical protein